MILILKVKFSAIDKFTTLDMKGLFLIFSIVLARDCGKLTFDVIRRIQDSIKIYQIHVFIFLQAGHLFFERIKVFWVNRTDFEMRKVIGKKWGIFLEVKSCNADLCHTRSVFYFLFVTCLISEFVIGIYFWQGISFD